MLVRNIFSELIEVEEIFQFLRQVVIVGVIDEISADFVIVALVNFGNKLKVISAVYQNIDVA